MIIRGTGPVVRKFADRAAARAEPFPWRGAVWVKDARIFTDGQEPRLFAGHDDACATILDLDDVCRPSGLLKTRARWISNAPGCARSSADTDKGRNLIPVRLARIAAGLLLSS